MREHAASATLVAVNGEVQAGDAPAAVGATIVEGQSVQPGPNGTAVVALADGSRARVQSSLAAAAAAAVAVVIRTRAPLTSSVD